MIKNGVAHIESIRDGRDLFIYGERVSDAPTHSSFRESIASVAALYDYQASPANAEKMTFRTDTGKQVNRCWQLPKTKAELIERRIAMESWAEQHCGFMGRTADCIASTIVGFYMGLPLFKEYNLKRAAALADYYHYARDNDLYLTYVIVNPQANQSKGASEQDTKDLVAHVCDEDAEGITVRGSKMLGTGAIFANEILVTTITPLRPGEEPYAITFSIPLNTKGVRILSRKSYEKDAYSIYDNPLSSRFDENDAVIFFEDVKVPWDRVFIDRDIAMCAKQFHGTPAHILQNYQAQIRLTVKLRFLAGLAFRISEVNGIVNFPQVRETLGQLAAEIASVDGLLLAMEQRGSEQGGYFVPDTHFLYAAQTLTQQLYPKVCLTLRELAGGGMIMLPASVQDMISEATAPYALKAQSSSVVTPEERVKFFKLAWDAVGSEFGSRHTQYEMFYAGAQFIVKGNSFRTYDWQRATGLVDTMLSGYDLRSGASKTALRGSKQTFERA